MAILNPSFEDAGTLPGEAEHWALSAATSLEEIAGFGTAPEEAWEDFERWFELLDSIDDVVVVLAFFDSALKGYEEFESGWANVVYLYDLPPAQLVTATFDGNAAEDCESGWSNVPYARPSTSIGICGRPMNWLFTMHTRLRSVTRVSDDAVSDERSWPCAVDADGADVFVAACALVA